MATTKKRKPPRRDAVAAAYNDFTAVLENMQGDFRAFGERLELLINKVDRLEKRVEKLEGNVEFIKDEVRFIRYELKEKVSVAELRALEQRVSKIESQLAA